MKLTAKDNKMKTKQAVKHTPGPWRTDENNKIWGESVCKDGPDCEMCKNPVASTLADDPDMEEADARLIAAAPDLLENAREEERQALDIIEAIDEAYPDSQDCPIWAESIRQTAVGMRDDARAAISSAEGVSK